MKHKVLAILLIALLGGMAVYYNQSVSQNTDPNTTANTGKAEPTK
jgi:hypothetical protein